MDHQQRPLAPETALRQQAGRWEALAAVSRALAAGAGVQTVMDVTAECAARMLDGAAGVRLLTDDGAWLKAIASAHETDEANRAFREILVRSDRPVGRGLAGQAMSEGRPVIVSAEELAARRDSPGVRSWDAHRERHPISSVAFVPIMVRGESQGVLVITRPEGGPAFTESDMAFARDLAERAGLALDNLRLLESVQRELEQRRQAERAVRTSEERFRALVRHSNELILVIDPAGRVLYASNSATHSYGYSTDAPFNETVRDLVHPDDIDEVLAAFDVIGRREGRGELMQFRMRHPDGSWRWVEAMGNNLLHDPAVEGIVVTMHDVTARVLHKDELQSRAAQQETVAAIGQRALTDTLDELFDDVVRTVADTFGAEFAGVLELQPGGDELVLRAGVGMTDEQEGALRVSADPTKTHAGYALHATGVVVVDDLDADERFGGTPLLRRLGVKSGITVVIPGRNGPFGTLGAQTLHHRTFRPDDVHFLQAVANVLAAAIERDTVVHAIRHQALHDALTELPNRALLGDRLEHALSMSARSGSQVALLLMDLDRFKEVNDTLGHNTGDLVLRQVADRLRSVTRSADTVARLGGDEFALVLHPVTDPDEVMLVATKVLRTLEEPIEVDGLQLQVGASIGIALAPDHGRDAITLMQRADVSMYRAKKLGAGWTVYAAEHDVRQPDRLALVSDLRRALEGDDIAAHYQPKVTLATRRVIGVEALARWNHPTLGWVAPEDFVTLAEQAGLIRPLTNRMLSLALAQCARWRDRGLDVPVAVNISALNLQQPGFVATVAKALTTAGVEAGMLQLEVTESAFVDGRERAVEVMTNLRALGVRMVIDDFGTGYSSLAYLKHLPADEIKIDRAFVADLLVDDRDQAIVRSVIDLAGHLGLSVVAEGVESEGVCQALASMGCFAAQGFHLCRPGPPEQIALWLENRIEPRAHALG